MNMLKAGSSTNNSSLINQKSKRQQEKLNVKTIDVDEWNSLDEFGRIELLSSLCLGKQSNKAFGI